jgi:hypothetical protein
MMQCTGSLTPLTIGIYNNTNLLKMQYFMTLIVFIYNAEADAQAMINMTYY